MPNAIFARRPLSATTIQYCTNDVHLPALRDIYTKKLDGPWMDKAMEESARRVVEACGPAYEPQSEAKRLGPWGSGSDKKVITMDEMLEIWEDERMDAMERDMLGEDEDEYRDWIDDYPDNSRDAAWDDTFDSCWEK